MGSTQQISEPLLLTGKRTSHDLRVTEIPVGGLASIQIANFALICTQSVMVTRTNVRIILPVLTNWLQKIVADKGGLKVRWGRGFEVQTRE